MCPATPAETIPADESAPAPRLLAFNDVETAFDDPERIAALAAGIEALQRDGTLVLDAGDSTAMGALAVVTDAGRGQSRPFLERVAPTAHVPGNHDFDQGIDWLLDYVSWTPGPWLAANVAADVFPGSVVVEAAGARVAVIGVAHPETPTFCSHATALTFEDPVDSVERELAQLDSTPPDHTVVLSHCGGIDEEIARRTAVDVVVGGHDHRRVIRTIEGTLVARTAGKGRELLEVVLGGHPRARTHRVGAFQPDERVLREYRERRAAVGLDSVLATQETALDIVQTGSVVASAYRSRARADVGLVFEGSIREPLEGDVSVGDLIGVVPFASDLVAVELTGEAVREVLAHSTGAIDETHGRPVVVGASPAAGTVGGYRLRDDERYRLAMMSYVPHSGLLPGITPERIVTNRGVQYEHVVEHVRRTGLSTSES